jgi:methylenetetrahydrofolate dehydrogenase (NADP+) / methenyltetrahydrofolate cyclohydrolase
MAEARIIDGKAAAAGLRDALRRRVEEVEASDGLVPELDVILVGDDPASRAYVRTKERMAREVGISARLIELPLRTTTAELLAWIEQLNRNPSVNGILVQLPLPEHVAAQPVLEAIAPVKDVDGFHPLNVGRLFSGSGAALDDLLVPCTPQGCLLLLRQTLGAALAGSRAVIVGRSNIVGKPMAALLLGADCTVTIAHSRTRDLAGECRRADVLVAAVGRPEMIRGDWIKEGATVIDVGINRVTGADGKGRLVGDVAYKEAAAVAGAITPVPGGVGPMTVACLLLNTIRAACQQHGIASAGMLENG